MKRFVLLFLTFFLFLSCEFFNKNSTDEEPSYTAKITWDSGLVSNFPQSTMLEGDSVYFYERPPEYNTVNIYALTRLDAATGTLIWRSSFLFSNIIFCEPVAIDTYIYVFLEPNVICSFNKETGELTAIAQIDIENKKLEINSNIAAYGQYLYFGMWSRVGKDYFVRLDVTVIHHDDPDAIQAITPEILWQPELGYRVEAKPVVNDNIVYTCTRSPEALELIELAGFDIDTKEKVFYKTFGGIEDVLAGYTKYPDKGAYLGGNHIFIHDGILYYISRSIAAWNFKTGKQLYRHVFPNDISNEKMYNSNTLTQALFYNGKIYYISNAFYSQDGYRNTHCIDATTGKLVWNSVAKGSFSLQNIPIIAHGRMYVSESIGLRVYEPETGRVIGVDKSFRGSNMDRNVLYGDLMICLQGNNYNNDYRLVAVDVGK